jgi:uridine monophosphate synthetase
MTFAEKLTAAIARNQSLLCVGLDPSPEFLPRPDRPFEVTDALVNRLEGWLGEIVAGTADLVCAYKPTLDIYLTLGAAGLALLERLLAKLPDEIPVILDAKHADLITGGIFARTAYERWRVDAVTVAPFSGQDHVAPFLVYPDRAIFALCYTENPSARFLQDTNQGDRAAYLQNIEQIKSWGIPDQVGLEVEASDPAVLRRIRAIAPTRSILLRGAWSSGILQTQTYSTDLTAEEIDAIDRNLPETLAAGRTTDHEGLIILVPRSALSHPNPARQVRTLHDCLNRARRTLPTLPAPPPIAPGDDDRDRPDPSANGTNGSNGPNGSNGSNGFRGSPISLETPRHRAPHREDRLILALHDLGCILFGEYVQASGAVFPYYIDLRPIISNPSVFNQILNAYARLLEPLQFDRIAGIPYGSLPTATGLSLRLQRPLVFPRKEVKAHGTQRLVEGNFQPGETVVVVDDILISGKSAIAGAKKLESVGLQVTDIVVFLDHEGGVKDRIAAAGYRAHSALALSDISYALHRAGRISDAQLAALQASHHGTVPVA